LEHTNVKQSLATGRTSSVVEITRSSSIGSNRHLLTN
jgi:hypothetical protein